MTSIGDPVAAHAPGHAALAQAAAAAASRRPAADAASGQASPEGGRRDAGGPVVPRASTGAPDPSGQSGRLVDVFA